MKRILVGIICLSLASTALADNDFTIRFSDGSTKTYYNVPDNLPLISFYNQIKGDFPNKNIQRDLTDVWTKPSVINVKEVSKEQINIPTTNVAHQTEEVSFWDSTAGTIVKIVIVGALLKWAWSASAPAKTGACVYSWQYAKDGSLCGGRASSIRPGGR